MANALNPIPTGPRVDRHEMLYRALLYPDWYYAAENRASSAAFAREPKLSVEIASIARFAEATLARFRIGTGLAEFNCGVAEDIGWEAWHEIDEQHPDNAAHAHLYGPIDKKARKVAARKLAQQTVVIVPTSFERHDD